MADLRPAFTAASIEVPSGDLFQETLFTFGPEAEQLSDFADSLSFALAQCGRRFGKAYRLGQGMGTVCSDAFDFRPESMQKDPAALPFSRREVARIRALLEDLNAAFPPFAARAVSDSIYDWYKAERDGRLSERPAESQRATLRRQAELWYNLLTGETPARSLLVPANYIDIARTVSRQMRRLVFIVLRVYWIVTLIVVLLVAGGVLLITQNGSTAAGIAAVFAFVSSLGLGAKGVNVISDLRQPLLQLATAFHVYRAITLLPEQNHDQAKAFSRVEGTLGGDESALPTVRSFRVDR